MIRITVELVPMGREDLAFVMARGQIFNDGRGSRARGNYIASLSRVSHYPPGAPKDKGGWWKETKIVEFPRTRLGVWDLLFRALRELVGRRNS